MAEYIDRESLISNLKEFANEQLTPLIENLIQKQPTADVVEVVRCCDCEHKQENPDINNTCYLTCNLKYGIRGTIDPTDFCSYGKMKVGDKE